MTKPFYSVIIPAINEAKRLPITLIDIDRHLSRQDKEYEIIVALSPSTDPTQEILERFEQLISTFKLINLKHNHGKGYAIAKGLQTAKGQYQIVMEADNAVAISEIEKIIPMLGEKASKKAKHHQIYDIGIGSRYIHGSHHDPKEKSLKKITGSIGRVLTRIFLLNLYDPNPIFFILSRKASEEIIPKLRTILWLTPLEILIRAKKVKYTLVEVPVFYSPDQDNRHRGKETIKSILEVFKLLSAKLKRGD